MSNPQTTNTGTAPPGGAFVAQNTGPTSGNLVLASDVNTGFLALLQNWANLIQILPNIYNLAMTGVLGHDVFVSWSGISGGPAEVTVGNYCTFIVNGTNAGATWLSGTYALWQSGSTATWQNGSAASWTPQAAAAWLYSGPAAVAANGGPLFASATQSGFGNAVGIADVGLGNGAGAAIISSIGTD